jgi:hypothetical protein
MKNMKKLSTNDHSFEEFTLSANGELFRSPVWNVYSGYMGEILPAPVILRKKGIFLLGATTLETLGKILGPIKRKPRSLPILLFSVWRALSRREHRILLVRAFAASATLAASTPPPLSRLSFSQTCPSRDHLPGKNIVLS